MNNFSPKKLGKGVGFLLVMALFMACSQFSDDNGENGQPVAKVNNEYLYQADLQRIVPYGTSPSDSAVKASNYIDHWVKQQLILDKAEESLSGAEKDVEQLLADYRAKLLIFRYKQKMLAQKLDTVVTESQILDFYSANAKEFSLRQPAVRAVFVKLPKDIPDITAFMLKLRRYNAEDSVYVEKYCYRNTVEAMDYSDGWRYFRDIRHQMPENIARPSRFLKNHYFVHRQDTAMHYFLRVLDYKLLGETAPLDLVREDVRTIILNKRKMELLKNIEKKLYQEAIQAGEIKLYD